MKNVNRRSFAAAFEKAYGVRQRNVDFRQDPKRPSHVIVTGRFRDGGTLVLRGSSLRAAAQTNSRIAQELGL